MPCGSYSFARRTDLSPARIQLMDVSGIGEKKFEKMRPFVRVK